MATAITAGRENLEKTVDVLGGADKSFFEQAMLLFLTYPRDTFLSSLRRQHKIITLGKSV